MQLISFYLLPVSEATAEAAASLCFCTALLMMKWVQHDLQQLELYSVWSRGHLVGVHGSASITQAGYFISLTFSAQTGTKLYWDLLECHSPAFCSFLPAGGNVVASFLLLVPLLGSSFNLPLSAAILCWTFSHSFATAACSCWSRRSLPHCLIKYEHYHM